MSNTELAHHGIKGMKWGKHATSAIGAVKSRAAGAKQAHENKADARLAKNGELGANVRIAGKTLAKSALVGAGTQLAAKVAGSNKAKVGITAAGTVLQLGITIKGLHDMVGVEKAAARSNAAGGQPKNQYVAKTKPGSKTLSDAAANKQVEAFLKANPNG